MFELLIMLTTGLLFLILGLLIWKKQKITLIHNYHYTRVTEENKPAYTEQMGKALVIMSVGMFITGIVDYLTQTEHGWLCFGVFSILGLVMMTKAQKKYNGGLF